jgi:IPT/TIG domain
MRMRTWLVVTLLCVAAALYALQALPRCTSVDPDTAKAGDVVSVKGENLGKKASGDVYLTDGSKDTKVAISEQSDTEIKFKVPQVKPGRYHVAILTANKASIIEQPVVLTIE